MINITFSKYVKMNGRLWEVNFRKLNRGNNLFYADTATLQGERISFEVQNEDGSWRINGNNIPQWITEFQTNIGSAIDQGMQEYMPRVAANSNMASA